MSQHAMEIAAGERFSFGNNWKRFLSRLDEQRILMAEASLRRMLQVDDLAGKSFLDIGSGSGLFSLAARRLGARVHSFDYDPQSVACTAELKRRFFPDDDGWSVEEASVLDVDYVRSRGEFDVVYSWGVLHHTGALMRALENAAIPVRPGGKLYLAIYNDQGAASERWLAVKRFYCAGMVNRVLVIGAYFSLALSRGLVIDLLHRKNPVKRYSDYGRSQEFGKVRGMSRMADWIDWLGGYPFEVSKPEEIFDFYRERGFVLSRLVTCGAGLGNNEFVFEKAATNQR